MPIAQSIDRKLVKKLPKTFSAALLNCNPFIDSEGLKQIKDKDSNLQPERAESNMQSRGHYNFMILEVLKWIINIKTSAMGA